MKTNATVNIGKRCMIKHISQETQPLEKLKKKKFCGSNMLQFSYNRINVDNGDIKFCFSECYSYKDADECHSVKGSVYYQNTCYNETQAAFYNVTELAHNKTQRSPPAQDFFE